MLFQPHHADNEKYLRAIFSTENHQTLSDFPASNLIKNILISQIYR